MPVSVVCASNSNTTVHLAASETANFTLCGKAIHLGIGKNSNWYFDRNFNFNDSIDCQNCRKARDKE